ncbi:MAG: radical SAM protein [Nitrospiraceae bacterium]|jgi:radical SAM protein with 4Fe4S-binding SPASM domain|nr:MAG: radical SAM protein [Nitrospiraceae bacterium]
MHYFLSGSAALKWLEKPYVFHLKKDDLYELDQDSFSFLRACAAPQGCAAHDMDFLDYCVKENIITKEKPSLKRPSLIPSPVPSLRYLELQITDRCNLSCRHCYIRDKCHHELSVQQVRRVLNELEELQGLRVLITGGEPFLHSDFSAINSMLPDFWIRKVLFTNGLMVSEEKLRGLNVDEIQFSIDGMERAHDLLRGKGTFRRVLDALKLSRDHGFHVSVATMVHSENLNDFDVMDELFKEIGVREWAVDIPCMTGKSAEEKHLWVTPEQGGLYLGYGFGEGLHTGASGFGCGLHLMAVLADSRAAKCTFYSDRTVGTIEDGLRLCWERIRPITLSDLDCDCEHIDVCRGGCRFRAELLGNALGRDLYKCRQYGIMV